MALPQNLSMALLGVCVLVSGCSMGGEPEGLPIGPISVPSTTQDRPIGMNGLSPSDFWDPAHQEALRDLGAAALLDADGNLVATPLLDTAGGRSVLRYVCQCALPEGTTAQSAGGYTFGGNFSFAPDWPSRALTTSEQRWLTACVLDHLNGLSATVSILLKGSHPALAAPPDLDLSAYTISDMTAFGNVFLGGSHAYVCVDPGISLACGLGVSAYTLERLCGLSPTCGATNLGLCTLSCTHDAAGNPTCAAPLFGATYPESISTKLSKTEGLTLYPLCGLL